MSQYQISQAQARMVHHYSAGVIDYDDASFQAATDPSMAVAVLEDFVSIFKNLKMLCCISIQLLVSILFLPAIATKLLFGYYEEENYEMHELNTLL